MENKALIVRKINIEHLMDALHELYHTGVEFVDIVGEIGAETDAILLRFSKDYMDAEFRENFDQIHIEHTENPNIDIKLSDDDINQIV
jgi:hypothetical protein